MFFTAYSVTRPAAVPQSETKALGGTGALLTTVSCIPHWLRASFSGVPLPPPPYPLTPLLPVSNKPYGFCGRYWSTMFTYRYFLAPSRQGMCSHWHSLPWPSRLRYSRGTLRAARDTPSIVFRHLPPKKDDDVGLHVLGCRVDILGYPRKDVVNQCLEFVRATVHRRLVSALQKVCVLTTLRASLSGTFLHTLPDLVTPLKGHSLSPRSCPVTRSAPSERFGY